MIDSKGIIDPDECIVRVSETLDGRTHSYYTIWDRHLHYWRSVNPFGECGEWTRDITMRAKFRTSRDAKIELSSMHQWRRKNS